jgi:hypothetical protein
VRDISYSLPASHQAFFPDGGMVDLHGNRVSTGVIFELPTNHELSLAIIPSSSNRVARVRKYSKKPSIGINI